VIQNKLLRNLVKFLLLVLILAFTFGGLRDVFVKKELTYALKIADVEYSFAYVNKIFQEAIKESRIKYGRDLSQNDTSKLKSEILGNIVDSTLILLEARRLGIIANDNMVKKEILKIPIFFKNGKFDKNIFEQVVKQYGVSEQGFIDKLKEDVVRATFVDSISANKSVIPGLTEIILEDVLQTRELELVKIPFSAFKIPNRPEDSGLKHIYEENKSKFQIPEKRKVEYMTISSELFEDQSSEVTEEKLRKIYEEKSFLFVEPEKRDVKQIQFSSLNSANKAREEIIKGVDFEKVAKKYAPNFNSYNLGIITAKDFDGDISGKLFNLKVGDISEIIETPLGLYIFKIEKIILEKKKSFDEVKDLLKKEYLKDVKFNNVLDSIKKIQTELKQGKTLEVIAKDYNQKLNLVEIINSVDENGDITNTKSFVENSFNTKLNQQSEIFPIDSDKFCILRVIEITPEKDQEFDELKYQLKQIWYSKELSSFINQIKISEGEKLNSEANTKLFDFSNIQLSKIRLSSSKFNNEIPLDFYKVIFESKINYYTKPFIDHAHEEVLLAKPTKVDLPSKDEIEKHRLLYDSQVNHIEQEIILMDIMKKLKDKFNVVVNPKIFDHSF